MYIKVWISKYKYIVVKSLYMSEEVVQNIRNAFKLIRSDIKNIDININESFAKGKWSTIYLFATRSEISTIKEDVRAELLSMSNAPQAPKNEFDDDEEDEY